MNGASNPEGGFPMVKQINLGITDTPVSGVSDLSLERAVLNFSADFRVKSQTPDEVVLVNLNSPADRPETIRISRREINNVYQATFGRGISPNVQASSTQGTELLVQWNGTFIAQDTEDPDFEQHLPMQTHLVVKAPKGLTADDLKLAIGRLISALFDEGPANTADAGLEAKLRGALTPKGM